MFTGIVEGIGRVEALVPEDRGARLVVALPGGIGPLDLGSSIAVNGACLTVAGSNGAVGSVACQVIEETLRRTNLGRLGPGAAVNLERSLAAGGRLDGHWVQGHVDGRARVRGRERQGISERLSLELLEPELARYLVAKGSVALDGVSLTVGEVAGGRFTVYLIPHTLEVTTLGERRPGDEVNVEVDIVAKYVERLVAARDDGSAG